MSVFLLKDPTCVFIHIPKTGGSSIRYGIWAEYDGPRHQIPPEWDDYFKFAFVRHPMTRFFSAFRDFTEYRGYKGSVEDFAREALDPNGEVENFASIKHHTFPQTHLKNLLHRADFVGRYENYAEDLDKILKTAGRETPRYIPRLRETEPTIIDISSKTLRNLETYYEKDFFVLGYSAL